MCFVTKDEEFLDKYMKIWEKVSSVINKNLIVNLCMIKNI